MRSPRTRTSRPHGALPYSGLTRAERLRAARARRRRARKAFGSALLAVVMSIPLLLVVSGGARAEATPISLFSDTPAPVQSSSDANSVELGVRFRSSVPGTVTALSYFKATSAPVACEVGPLVEARPVSCSLRSLSRTRPRRVGSRRPCRRRWTLLRARVTSCRISRRRADTSRRTATTRRPS